MTDSNLYTVCGISWQLDLLDLDWAAERLPIEEFFLSSPSIELQDIISLDGNETYLGYGGNGEGGGMNVEMWIDKGDEFFINETEESNIAFDEEILLTGEQIGK